DQENGSYCPHMEGFRAFHSVEQRSHPGSADAAENITDEEIEGLDNPDAATPAFVLRSPICELKGHEGAVIAADWFTSGKQIVTAFLGSKC
ncbi:WD repeat-containing protein 37, partial [Desmophyllum pertusum]